MTACGLAILSVLGTGDSHVTTTQPPEKTAASSVAHGQLCSGEAPVWQPLKMLDIDSQYDLRVPLLGIPLGEINTFCAESMRPPKNLGRNVHSSIIHHSQKAETIQTSANG